MANELEFMDDVDRSHGAHVPTVAIEEDILRQEYGRPDSEGVYGRPESED